MGNPFQPLAPSNPTAHGVEHLGVPSSTPLTSSMTPVVQPVVTDSTIKRSPDSPANNNVHPAWLTHPTTTPVSSTNLPTKFQSFTNQQQPQTQLNQATVFPPQLPPATTTNSVLRPSFAPSHVVANPLPSMQSNAQPIQQQTLLTSDPSEMKNNSL